MLSGRRLDLLNPSPLDIEIEDIAHGLARVARWNGQTKGAHAFSVAQHCLLVEALIAHAEKNLDRQARLAALLHDAPEYVIGDMISPFKAALGVDYRAFENKLLAAIHLRFGLPAGGPGERLARLDEMLGALRRLWQGETVSLRGRYVQLDEARVRPLVAPRIRIEIAAKGPRMLDLVARHADVWDVNLPPLPARVAQAGAWLAERCAKAGRRRSTTWRLALLQRLLQQSVRGTRAARGW